MFMSVRAEDNLFLFSSATCPKRNKKNQEREECETPFQPRPQRSARQKPRYDPLKNREKTQTQHISRWEGCQMMAHAESPVPTPQQGA
jgi:hypothetical protein